MMSNTPQLLLSIIIPTLNEAASLPFLLDDLRRQKGICFEIIVGDGGSSDSTIQIAKGSGVKLVSSRRGRGAQMNAAALLASGSYFLFLHADSRIDEVNLLHNALLALISAKSDSTRVAGHFPLKFIRTNSDHSMAYRYAEGKTSFNRVNTTNGDQGMLLSRDFFNLLGGFDERLPFLEDQRIAEEIRVQGEWITLPGYIKTSARRFEAEGFHRRYILMSIMMGLYTVGVEEFFAHAPKLYQQQQDTSKLYLSPFFSLIYRMMIKDWGVSGSIRVFYLLGRYIRQNSWQMFYFFDVCLYNLMGERNYPLLRFHDRVFEPCTNFSIFNALVGVLCFLWFMMILAPIFRLIEFSGFEPVKSPHKKEEFKPTSHH